MNLLRAMIIPLMVIAVIIGVLRLTAVRWWQIPGDAPHLSGPLSPSLQAGDWVLSWRGTSPGFADLALCEHPTEPGEIVIGRILGEAGDTISLSGDNVKVNGTLGATAANCEDDVAVLLDYENGQHHEGQCVTEAFANTWYIRGALGDRGSVSFARTVVPDGHVYLVSDNRAFPYDSRHFGPVPTANCRETVFFRLWSKHGLSDVKNRFDFIR